MVLAEFESSNIPEPLVLHKIVEADPPMVPERDTSSPLQTIWLFPAYTVAISLITTEYEAFTPGQPPDAGISFEMVYVPGVLDNKSI